MAHLFGFVPGEKAGFSGEVPELRSAFRWFVKVKTEKIQSLDFKLSATRKDSLTKMADNVEHEVSSTTPFYTEEVHHYQAEPEPQPDQPKQDLFSVDDIVDLVGGAHDALNRHIAADNASHEFTETHPEDSVSGVPEPGPDSTSYSFLPDTPEVVAPKAEPESTKIEPEPLAAPESDALPVVEPWKAAPAPAEAAERPAVTEEPSAPSSCKFLNGKKGHEWRHG